MLPRFSTRRCFLSLVGVTCLVLLIINLTTHQYGQEQPVVSRQNIFRGLFETATETRPKISETSYIEDDDPEINQQQEEATTTMKSETDIEKASRPWFMTNGERRPEPAKRAPNMGRRIAKIWPQEDPGSDRITNQLMYVPPEPVDPSKPKKILMFNGVTSWSVKPGSEVFEKCPVSACTLTANRAESVDADAILFKDHLVHPGHPRPYKQVWILYYLECPYHTQHIKYSDEVNWTATYRRDSDIVAPYEKWTYYDENVTDYPGPLRDFTANKTHKVAWFVSNCGARNGRLSYAQELQKYIDVDIYGACGKHKCPRWMSDKCFDMLDTKYKFYLAFENSNCKDYITEKFFVNGLGHNVLPIVMGARPEEYAQSAPKHSYIHVDEFKSPKELAEYLHKLDKDDDLYNSYFKWKGTGEFINTHFFCRLCAMLHDDIPTKSYRDINDWWRGAGICTTGSWRNEAM